MAWFGPSKDELWQQLSQEIGGDFVAGKLWKGSKVQAHKCSINSVGSALP